MRRAGYNDPDFEPNYNPFAKLSRSQSNPISTEYSVAAPAVSPINESPVGLGSGLNAQVHSSYTPIRSSRRRRLRGLFSKPKSSDEENSESVSIASPKVEISSHVQSQDTIFHRCLRFVGLHHDRSTKAPGVGLGEFAVADDPLGTSVQNEITSIFDMKRERGSHIGTCRSPGA